MSSTRIETNEKLEMLLKSKRKQGGDLCPADQRIQGYLNSLLKGVDGDVPRLPGNTLVLDEPGLARKLSLPLKGDAFTSDIVQSYRVKQGVLHNPKHDRRTTKGVFHVAEGGLLVPGDKIQVPLITFSRMLRIALQPLEDIAMLPITSELEEKVSLLTSLYMRPMVCPEVRGFIKKKSLEIRFFAPGNLVSNLDFVEAIFGNAGDPYRWENDAGLDVDHWTGHTGCVILAPQLIGLKKKELGLPHYDEATERQRRQGVCWNDENEVYNSGKPFKLTSRDKRGIMVTLIADNYFGYCKKEVKTQISLSANLFGLCEEEHAGGAAAYASYNMGAETHIDNALQWSQRSYEDMIKKFGASLDVRPEGYAVDEKYSDIIYVPENSKFSLKTQTVSWTTKGQTYEIKLLKDHTYFLPSGYKLRMEKLSSGAQWRLIGTRARGTVCHKPCTVSGGGKSEISKSISDAIIQGPIFTANLEKDIERIKKILHYDFSARFRVPYKKSRPSRPVLSKERSLGSVIKLFTPSEQYSDEYNVWLASIDHNIKIMIYELKRAYKEEWGDDWADYLSVDMINNYPGHELKIGQTKLIAHYLRVGLQEEGSWRIFKLRPDFCPSFKIQMEDDITASVVVPTSKLSSLGQWAPHNPSLKIVANCESKLFQRPDDAIHRGYDKQAEADLSSDNTFLSNYEPLTHHDAQKILEDTINFDQYTQPVKDLIEGFAREGKDTYFVSSSHPRLVDGKPTKNPRYLQNRPDLVKHRDKYIAMVGERLSRFLDPGTPVDMPVTAVMSGRRCNPADPEQNVPALAVYGPIHYQELPELFMDYICSVTGKSPSTTGFGSEGALTKGPFNAITTTADLNNALLSFVLTGYHGFSSAAGYIGPNVKVDHDVSLLMPEIFSRMSEKESDPQYLIDHGYLEKIDDFEHQGKKVNASRLGYRITIAFANSFLGRIFDYPHAVFSEEMLKPEKQDEDTYVQGIQNLVETQRLVGQRFIDDGSVVFACPPIRALIYIMATGKHEGKGIEHPDIRNLFKRETILKSDWYQNRLKIKQERELALWKRHHAYLQQKMEGAQSDSELAQRLQSQLQTVLDTISQISSKAYLESLVGTIGADPIDQEIVS